MFITDIPSASVVSAIAKRVFSMSSLGSQNQRRVFTIFHFLQKRPLHTPWQDVVSNHFESTYSKKKKNPPSETNSSHAHIEKSTRNQLERLKNPKRLNLFYSSYLKNDLHLQRKLQFQKIWRSRLKEQQEEPNTLIYPKTSYFLVQISQPTSNSRNQGEQIGEELETKWTIYSFVLGGQEIA